MMIKTLAASWDNNKYFCTWDHVLEKEIVFNQVYEVIQTFSTGFLICHDKRFYIIPFERCEQVSPLEAVL